jgi:ribosomal protein S18 acetylase RimI-like enzyme
VGSRLRAAIKRWGLCKALWAGVAGRLRPWFMLCQVQVRANQSICDAEVSSDDIQVRLASEPELFAAVIDLPKQLDADFLQSALSRGDLCAAAFDGGHMVGFQWASFTTAQINEQLAVEFPSSHRYGYKGFVHPDYRGRRIAWRVMRYLDSECLLRGYEQTMVYVETHNYASLANLERLGNRCIGYAGYLSLGRRCHPFATKGARRHGFSFYLRAAQGAELKER